MNQVEELVVEINTLANLVGHLTGSEAGVWIDPHKAKTIAINIMAAGYRAGATENPLAAASLERAFDEGFTACGRQWTTQRDDPSHPITRVNPYR